MTRIATLVASDSSLECDVAEQGRGFDSRVICVQLAVPLDGYDERFIKRIGMVGFAIDNFLHLSI
jgi:hypothetical protein